MVLSWGAEKVGMGAGRELQAGRTLQGAEQRVEGTAHSKDA